jgi:hypothetical protein
VGTAIFLQHIIRLFFAERIHILKSLLGQISPTNISGPRSDFKIWIRSAKKKRMMSYKKIYFCNFYRTSRVKAEEQDIYSEYREEKIFPHLIMIDLVAKKLARGPASQLVGDGVGAAQRTAAAQHHEGEGGRGRHTS